MSAVLAEFGFELNGRLVGGVSKRATTNELHEHRHDGLCAERDRT